MIFTFDQFTLDACKLEQVADNIRKLVAEEREGRIMVQMHNRAADFNYKTRGMSLKQKAEYRKTLKPLVIAEAKIETNYSYY